LERKSWPIYTLQSTPPMRATILRALTSPTSPSRLGKWGGKFFRTALDAFGVRGEEKFGLPQNVQNAIKWH